MQTRLMLAGRLVHFTFGEHRPTKGEYCKDKETNRTKSLRKKQQAPFPIASLTVTSTFYAVPPLTCIYDERRDSLPP